MAQAVFLDRDGVICQDRADYVKSRGEFVFLDGALEALHSLAKTHFKIVVVTNQSAINRSLVRAEIVEEIHEYMIAAVSFAGGRIDRVYYCPHRPDENCDCRKPKPGLVLQAAKEMNLDLAHSFLIGDYITDVETAYTANCSPILVLTGRGRSCLDLVKSRRLELRLAENLLEAAALVGEWAREEPLRI